MKLWMVLRSYGVANLRNFLRTHVKMAKHFEGLVAMDGRFEIVVPRNFAMVCFRLLSPADDARMVLRMAGPTSSTGSCSRPSTRLVAST
ncbi:hypothetical protein AAC387_Pa07g3358 [Persea americana]